MKTKKTLTGILLIGIGLYIVFGETFFKYVESIGDFNGWIFIIVASIIGMVGMRFLFQGVFE